MKLKPSANLTDALGKVTGELEAIIALPKKAEQKTMRQMPEEAYGLIDSTLSAVIIRLGASLLPVSAAEPPASGRRGAAGRARKRVGRRGGGWRAK